MHAYSFMSNSLQLFVASQAPPSTGFPRQEHWHGLLFPLPGDLSDPGIEPISPASPALADRFFTTSPPGKSMLAPWSMPECEEKLRGCKSFTNYHLWVLLQLDHVTE